MVQNTGNTGVFFDEKLASSEADNLISAQIDPSQPQIQGLSPITNPLVADRHLSARLPGFDPDQFDLSDHSLLMRFLTALIAGAGIGGVRRQQIMARMSATLNGTNFIELDSFWGAIFGLNRAPEETLPTNADGTPVDPSVDIADSVTWDVAQARDGRYRSRIEQLAKAMTLGPTYDGVAAVCWAVLNCEIEIVESWLLADFATAPGAHNTYLALQSQYGTWGNMAGNTWGKLALGENATFVDLQAPIGNRGEIVIIPGRPITEYERYQLHLVLDKLLPAHMMATVASEPFVLEQDVPCRDVVADSVEWNITSRTRQQATTPDAIDLYPGSTDYESGRPAMSQYTGEKWTFNGRIASVTAYAEDAFGVQQGSVDYQTVTYADGTRHDYAPGDALVDSRVLAQARAASEGVTTTFPYVPGRFTP